MGNHHINVCPVYLHMKNSSEYLPQAMKPSDLRGCVGNKVGAYICEQPLPIFPEYRSQTRWPAAGAAWVWPSIVDQTDGTIWPSSVPHNMLCGLSVGLFLEHDAHLESASATHPVTRKE